MENIPSLIFIVKLKHQKAFLILDQKSPGSMIKQIMQKGFSTDIYTKMKPETIILCQLICAKN